MSLGQVQDARPALDYASRYNDEEMSWSTAMFIEAVYRSLDD